jgi:hypothetical protein
MRRMVIALLLVAGALLWGPHAPAQAQELSQNPECQRRYEELARPYFEQMLWYARVASAYPLTPNGRPIVTGWPYSAYGPGNGYGPGTPYGPNFGPWGFGSFGPGFGGPGGYGFGPYGIGGAPWLFANAIAGTGAATLATLPPALGVSAVVAQLASAPGGLGALAAGDLIAAASLQQSLVGNVLSASSLAQSILANQIAAAGLRQAVIGNRIAAAELNATLAAFAYERVTNLKDLIEGIEIYIRNTCPAATENGL